VTFAAGSAGTIGGTGDINVKANSTGSITTLNVNNTGTFTNSGTGTGVVTYTSQGANSTGIIQASDTSPLQLLGFGTISGQTAHNTITSTGAAPITTTAGGTNTGTGDLILKANSTGSMSLKNLNHTGTITNSGTGTGTVMLAGTGSAVTGLIQNSAGSKLVSNGGAMTADTQILEGTLELTGPTAASMMRIGDPTVSNSRNATFIYNGIGGSTSTAEPITVMAGSSGVLGIQSAQASTLTGPITLNNKAEFASLAANTFTVNSVITGSSVIKTHAANVGTVTLGANLSGSYTGQVQVTHGRLNIPAAGNINGASGVMISGPTGLFTYGATAALTAPVSFGSGGGMLAGTGVVSAVGGVTVSGDGSAAPGNGTLSIAKQKYTTGLTFAADGNYRWEHTAGNNTGTGGSSYDQVEIDGGLGLSVEPGAGLDVVFGATTDLTNVFWDSPRSWTIAPYVSGSATAGTFASGDITVSGTSSGLVSASSVTPEGFFTTSLTGNNLVLNWTPGAAVPEPASLMLLGLGAVGLVSRRRR
jgi:filamentous hemagglutinin